MIFSPTLEKCEKYTLKTVDDANERVIYIFDYSGIELNWKKLKKLEDNNLWGTIKHPYIRNYINQKLIPLTPFYIIEILLYLTFAILLHIFIHNNSSMPMNDNSSMLMDDNSTISIAENSSKPPNDDFLVHTSSRSSIWINVIKIVLIALATILIVISVSN